MKEVNLKEQINKLQNLNKCNQKLGLNADNQYNNVNKINSKPADYLWMKLIHVYGRAWVNKFGEHPSSVWIEGLSDVPKSAIDRGIQNLKNKGSSYPTNLFEFMGLIYDVDTYEAFYRFINHEEPLNQVELLARKESNRIMLRTKTAKESMKLYNEIYVRIQKKIDSGYEVEETQPLLTKHTQEKKSDFLVQESVNNGSKNPKAQALMERIRNKGKK